MSSRAKLLKIGSDTVRTGLERLAREIEWEDGIPVPQCLFVGRTQMKPLQSFAGSPALARIVLLSWHSVY